MKGLSFVFGTCFLVLSTFGASFKTEALNIYTSQVAQQEIVESVEIVEENSDFEVASKQEDSRSSTCVEEPVSSEASSVTPSPTPVPPNKEPLRRSTTEKTKDASESVAPVDDVQNITPEKENIKETKAPEEEPPSSKQPSSSSEPEPSSVPSESPTPSEQPIPSNPPVVEKKECSHNFVLADTVEPTCFEDGYRNYICLSCKESKTETMPKLEHNYLFISTVSPTEESEGFDIYQCSHCGTEEKRNIVAPLPKPKPMTARDSLSTVYCSDNNYILSAMPHEEYRDLVQKVIDGRGEIMRATWVNVNEPSTEGVANAVNSGHFLLTYTYAIYTRNLENEHSIALYLCNGRLDDFNSLCDNALAVKQSLGITSNTDVLTALTLIQNYVCDNLDYDYDNYTGNPLGIMTTHKGVCSVYSMNFQLICQACGIECFADDSHNHAYNYVLAPDGTRLYIDTCWDDSTKTRDQFFLRPYDEFMAAHGW